jgi:hypothetical protein
MSAHGIRHQQGQIAQEEIAMKAAVDQFCNRLLERLNTMQCRREAIKAYVEGRSETVEKVVRDWLEEARTKLQALKDQAERTRASLTALAQQKTAGTMEAVSEWKAKRDIEKLVARANRAEAYAADAIDYALTTIDQAAEAVLDAVVARIDADAAREPVPAKTGSVRVSGWHP